MKNRRSLNARVGGAALAAWGGITGIAPHVLHHVVPLTGAAVLAGATGRLLFGAVMLAVSVPFLLRLYRRFDTWMAPVIALVVMAAMFSLSSFVIGPAISGERSPNHRPGTEHPVREHHER